MSAPCAAGSRSFSLTEVVVALGISTVAIVSILGLFPLGFDTVRESEAETQAAILARTIFSDLDIGIRERGFTNSLMVAGKNLTNASTWINVSLVSNAASYWVGFRKEIQAGDGGMIGNPFCLRPVTGTNGALPAEPVLRSPPLDVLAQLTVTRIAPRAGGMQSLVDLVIEYPANASQTNRFRHSYTWLVAP